jgi:hypothetical protein
LICPDPEILQRPIGILIHQENRAADAAVALPLLPWLYVNKQIGTSRLVFPLRTYCD